MEKNEYTAEQLELLEKWKDEERRGRIKRWLIFSIILTVFFLYVHVSYQSAYFHLPFYHTIPFGLPALMSWDMFIGVTKKGQH